MSFVRSSKFRHIFGTTAKADLCYNGIKTSGLGDTNCAVSEKFLAILKDKKIFIIPLEKVGRCEENVMLFLDCKEKVLDVQWSPFNDCLLASADEAGDILVWLIPDGGLTESTKDAHYQLVDKHTRKVTSIQWHPSADYIIAACGYEEFVTVWNCLTPSEPIAEIPVGAAPNNIAWNMDGSKLGVTTRVNKNMGLVVVDPRSGEILKRNDEIYSGMKPAKLVFLNNEDVMTVGCDRTANRSIIIWDKDSLEEKNELDLDSGSAAVNAYYDRDLSLLYLFGKGESTVKYYEVIEDKGEIYFLSAFSSNESQKGGCFLPKRCVNTATTEIARFYKLGLTKCEPVSLVVPRKSDHFQTDLYPATASSEPALTPEEWLGGANKPPKTVAFEPGSASKRGEAKPASKAVTAVRKPVPKAATVTARASTSANNGLPEGVDLNELVEDMRKVKATVRKLNKRVATLEGMLEQKGGDACEEE